MCKKRIEDKYLIDKLDRLILPDNLKPKVYDIHLNCNVKEFKYRGDEIITLDVLKETDKIIIHSIDCEILNVEIQNQKSIDIEFNEIDEIAIIKFEKPILVGNDVSLKIEFTGLINDKLKGFYRSKYQTDNGEDHWICSTQFEASDARRCIPCFDEPSLKSIFNIKLTIDKDLTAISNSMESSIIENNDNTKTYTFEPTPIMSTYLIAFVIGDLEYIEGYTKIDKTRVRVYKGKGVKDSGEYALEIGIKVIDFFVDYFGISLPLKKVDHCAIPSFAFYAMENYGLLTYHDIYLLTSDKTTLLNKQQLVDMVSHEVSHQWFGNLVTMEWWSQLWLNEGFANFFGYLATNHLYPEWNMWLQFSQNQVNKALYLDSLTNTHPIEVPVHTTAEISEIFDDISYNKGSSIVKMLEDRLGADKFRKAINHYLTKFSFKNTVTEDLWDSLSLFAGDVDITKFVNSFTKYPGYPVVSIVQQPTTVGTFKLKQKKFTVSQQQQQQPTETSTIWNCFIKFQTTTSSGNELFKFTLDKEEDTITIPNFKAGDWIKPNYGQTGYFRIDYSEIILKSLIPIIKAKQLSAVDRIGVVSDVFYGCKSGSTCVSTFMDLIFNAYKDETECDIWNFIILSLNEIQDLIFDRPTYNEKFNKMYIDLLVGVSEKLGFDTIDGESSGDRLLRSLVNSKLVLLGHQKTIDESSKKYQQFKLDKSSLKSDITHCVLLSALNNGGSGSDSSKAVQQYLLDQFLNTTDIAEKKQYLNVLSYGSPTIELYNNILLFSLSSSSVEPCDIAPLWSTHNAQFKLHTWKFFCDNFKTINHMFKDNILYPSLIPQIFCNKLNDQQLSEINQFFSNNPAPTADRSIKQELENIKNNTNWFNNTNNFNLSNWLNLNYN